MDIPFAHKFLKSDRKIHIVGGGITALVAGALLAKAGHRITVLEARSDVTGGHARTIEVAGLDFSAGPTYVWNFGPDQIGDRILAHLGLKAENPFELMNPEAFENIFIGDNPAIEIPMGLDKFYQVMIKRFPAEKKGLKQFFTKLKRIVQGTELMHDEGLFLAENINVKLFGHMPLNWNLLGFLLKHKSFSLKDLFDECQLPPACRRILFAHGAIFAENESTVSIGAYAGATGYYHTGASFPKKGFAHLINGLVDVIEQHGGQVLLNKKVIALKKENERITTITCADNSQYFPDQVISNLAPNLTAQLLGQESYERKYDPSNSVVGSYFVLTKDFAGLEKLKGKNYWWQKGETEINFNKAYMSKLDMLYLYSPSANDLHQLPNPHGYQSLLVYTPGNYKQEQAAAQQGETYLQKFRGDIKAEIIEHIERQFFPELTAHLVECKIFTPLLIEAELGAELGNVYGRRPNVDNVLIDLRRCAGVKNLNIACASVGLPGVATAFQTANVLVKQLINLKR